MVGAIQSGDFFAVFCPAYPDLSLVDGSQVKGVHGLAVFQHDVVGNVHDVVDGAHAHGAQPLPHPLGGGDNLHVADHPGGVAGAQVGGGGLHIQQLHQVALGPALDLRLVEAQGDAVGGGGLRARPMTERPVGGVGG